jgi:hypothetical protein
MSAQNQECPVREHEYYCRGCGQPLAKDFPGLFHPACLRIDKRHRTREKRRVMREEIGKRLRGLGCPNCGANLGSGARSGPEPFTGLGGEASRGASEPVSGTDMRNNRPNRRSTEARGFASEL